MKLELKHLAPYLPYGLKYYPSEKSDLFFDLYADYAPNSSWKYDLALEENDEYALKLKSSYLFQKEPFVTIEDNEIFLGQFESSLGFDVDDVYISEVKPILRPLSDLTKEIEVNGEKFAPFKWFNFINSDIDFETQILALSSDFRWLESTNYGIIEKLLEWHFDVFGLIEKGLAIDINTLEL